MADSIEIKDLDLVSNLKDTDSVLIDDSGDGIAKRATITQIKEKIGSSGGTGITDHAALSNLGYEQSGHTGFARAADLALKADRSELEFHENDATMHTTQAEKDTIAMIPNKLEASNIKEGSNITIDVNGNDVTISAAGGSGGIAEAPTDGKLYGRKDLAWSEVVGSGVDGREVSLRATEEYVQWQYAGAANWTNLIAIADITGVDGVDGREISLQVASGYIQWQYSGSGVWTNLIAFDDLKGEPGVDGKSAYRLAVDAGFIGDEQAWFDSLKGADGIPGTTTWAGITDKPIENIIISATPLTPGVSPLANGTLYLVYE